MASNRLNVLGAGAATVLVAGTAVAVWLLLANGSDDSNAASVASPSATAEATQPPSTATPTWSPFVAGTATPRVEQADTNHSALQSANLVVYADEFSDESWANGIHQIVAYDLDAGRPAASFRVSYPVTIKLVGRELLSHDSTTVTLSDLGGESQRVIYAGPGDRVVTGFAVSNDGAFVAIGTEGADTFPDERSELLVVELATGTTTRTFTFDDLGVTP